MVNAGRTWVGSGRGEPRGRNDRLADPLPIGTFLYIMKRTRVSATCRGGTMRRTGTTEGRKRRTLHLSDQQLPVESVRSGEKKELSSSAR